MSIKVIHDIKAARISKDFQYSESIRKSPDLEFYGQISKSRISLKGRSPGYFNTATGSYSSAIRKTIQNRQEAKHQAKPIHVETGDPIGKFWI
jgi:hypothetical protein